LVISVCGKIQKAFDVCVCVCVMKWDMD
jgi:hypothetical protein